MATNRSRYATKKRARERLGRSQNVPKTRIRLARAIRDETATEEDGARLADEAKQIGLSAEI